MKKAILVLTIKDSSDPAGNKSQRELLNVRSLKLGPMFLFVTASLLSAGCATTNPNTVPSTTEPKEQPAAKKSPRLITRLEPGSESVCKLYSAQIMHSDGEPLVAIFTIPDQPDVMLEVAFPGHRLSRKQRELNNHIFAACHPVSDIYAKNLSQRDLLIRFQADAEGIPNLDTWNIVE